MQIIRKPPKPLIITLIVVLSIALLIAATAAGIYLYSETVRFDHRDCSSVIALMVYDEVEGYSVNYPYFGNSLMLSGSDARSYAFIFGSGGKNNIRVYDAVNAPIDTWVDYLASRYKKRINLD